MQITRQLQPVHIQLLLEVDLAVPQTKKLVMDPCIVEIAVLREELLFRGTGFSEVTILDQYLQQAHGNEGRVSRDRITYADTTQAIRRYRTTSVTSSLASSSNI